MLHNDINKVALNAARNPRLGRRLFYAQDDRPVPAPSGGVIIEGYPYQAGELIPEYIIHFMDGNERKDLFARIDQDRQERVSRKPTPGQQSFMGVEPEDDQEKEMALREKARWFSPRGVILDHTKDEHKPYYGKMYDWMMDFFRDWYENLNDDQHAMATWDRTVRIGEMNKYLRHQTGEFFFHTGPEIEEAIDEFDNMIDGAPPLDQDVIVYKGNAKPERFGTDRRKGAIYTSKEILSTSIDAKTSINGYLGTKHDALLARIMLPKGTRVAAVTAEQINEHGRSRDNFIKSPDSYEQELTLPRDSTFRYVNDPHYEDFIQEDGTIRRVLVADIALVPQPTPEEAPHLPHAPIESFSTNGYKGYNSHRVSSYHDPWYGYDPDDMKSDKFIDLEKIVDDYESDPGHDAEALEQIKNLKFDLDTINHTDYSDPGEYDQAMAEVVSNAENIVSNAPDHTDELWANFNPKDEQAKVLGELEGVISRFVRSHDTTRPVIADYLKQLKLIREQVVGSLEGNIRDEYTYPDEYSDDLSKYLLNAHTLADLGHTLDQEQKSGQPSLFLGQDVSYDDLKNWLVRKKSFDKKVIKIREFDPGLADQVQELWDKATHRVGLGPDSKNLMNLIEKGSTQYANGISPEASGFGLVRLSDMTRGVNHQVMLHKSINDNISRAKSQGIFQGSDVPDTSLKEWARNLYEFRKNLDDYRKNQEAAGNLVDPRAAQAQVYWDRATKELLPSYETMAILTRLVDYSNALKEGYATDYSIDDIKSRLNSQLIIEGSPSAKLGAKLDQLNDRYREANERFKNSHYYNEKYKGYLEKFKNYIKSKGVNGTQLEHIEKLPPEIQEQILTQANNLITNISKATSGYMDPAQIWPTPLEHVQVPASPSVTTTLDKLRYKASKQKILSDFMDTVFKYNKTSFYDTNYHKKLNDLIKQASNDYPDGPDQLAAMREVARRAADLLDQKPNSIAALHAPLPEASPAPLKTLAGMTEPAVAAPANPTHSAKSQKEWLDIADWHDRFKQKRQEFKTLMEEYMNSPEYNQSIHKDLGQAFWKKTIPPIFESQYLHASPKEKQDTLDHFDDMIARARDLFVQDKIPESAPVTSLAEKNTWTPEHGWSDLFHQKIMAFKALKNAYAEAPHYDKDKESKVNLDFWKHIDPASLKFKYVNGTPAQRQEILNHFDRVIQQARTNFSPPSAPAHEPKSSLEKSFEDMFSDAGVISHKLHDYEDMPLSSQEKLGEFGDRYNDLRDKWYKDHSNYNHIVAKLNHLYNDVSRETEEHSDKLAKIANHAQEIQPQLASGPGLQELEAKFPEHTSQIHLDLANYKKSTHFDPMSYGLAVDLIDGMAHNWEEKKDPEIAHDDLRDIMKYTKKKATNNDTLPHQSIMPAAPKPLFGSVLAPEPHSKPSGGSAPPRIPYGRLLDQARHARNGNKVTLNQGIRRFYSQDKPTQAPLDFTPHTHGFGTNDELDQPYFQRMYDFHMGHYGPFLDTLSDPEKKMISFRRPVNISHMSTYLRGRFFNPVTPEHEKLIQAGIRTMDGIIAKSPPTTQDIILYRGMRNIHPDTIPPGTLIHEPGFPSMSLNAFVSASNFSKNGKAFRIRVPRGTRLAPVTASQIHDFDYQPHEVRFHNMEQELLPGRGHTLKITGTIEHDPHNNFHYVNAELLPQGPVTEQHRKPWGTTE